MQPFRTARCFVIVCFPSAWGLSQNTTSTLWVEVIRECVVLRHSERMKWQIGSGRLPTGSVHFPTIRASDDLWHFFLNPVGNIFHPLHHFHSFPKILGRLLSWGTRSRRSLVSHTKNPLSIKLCTMARSITTNGYHNLIKFPVAWWQRYKLHPYKSVHLVSDILSRFWEC